MTSHERTGRMIAVTPHSTRDQEPVMIEHRVVLAVAGYASAAAAEQDFDTVRRRRDSGALRHVAIAVLHKGSNGALDIYRSDRAAASMALGGALLGAALAVLAAPLGISYLQPVATTPAGWAQVTALVEHLWQNVPQEKLHQMSNLLESSPAGLILVAVDQTTEDTGALLSKARQTVVTQSTTAELGADITRAVDDANARR